MCMCIDYFHCGKVITLVENYILKLKTFLQESSYSSVTFKRIKTNHIQIKAEINGLKGVFIIDTGASNTCIDLENHKLFKIFPEESPEKALSATDEISKTMISKSNKIKIGKWMKENISIVLFDMSFINKTLVDQGAERVNGIIGSDLLKKGKAIIDYSSNKLFLKD